MNNKSSILPDLGKVPPQSIDCEEAVLGIILICPGSIDNVSHILNPEAFYKDAHKRIFQAAINLVKHGIPVDIITITEELRNFNELESIGGPVYLSKLTNRIISERDVEYYATVIKEKYIRRELIRLTGELNNYSFDESIDLADIIDFAETSLLQVTEHTRRKDPVRIGTLVDGLIDKINKIINKEIKLIGVPSGLTNVDRLTGGFKNGELIIIAGRPSMGKSALALQIAKNNASMNLPVLLFSCEMSGESLAQRSLSAVSGKTNTELYSGRCEIEQLLKSSESIIALPLFIDDSSGMSVLEIRSITRKMILKNNIKMIIIDYLQLMRGEGDTREQVVSNISRGLKSIAKDLNIPVIALSQLNRKAEERSDKHPLMSDLRESGSIEQDADMIIFVYRASQYGLKTIYADGREIESIGIMELILAKNRNGATGSLLVNHNEALTEIRDEAFESSPVEEAGLSF